MKLNKNTIILHFFLIWCTTPIINEIRPFNDEENEKSIVEHLRARILENVDVLNSRLEKCCISKLILHTEYDIENLYAIKKLFDFLRIKGVKMTILFNCSKDFELLQTLSYEMDYLRLQVQEMLMVKRNEAESSSSDESSIEFSESPLVIFQKGKKIYQSVDKFIRNLKMQSNEEKFVHFEPFIFLHDASASYSTITTIIRHHYEKDCEMDKNNHDLMLKIKEWFEIWCQYNLDNIHQYRLNLSCELTHKTLYIELAVLINHIKKNTMRRITDYPFFWMVSKIAYKNLFNKAELKESMELTIEFIYLNFVRASKNNINFFSLLSKENHSIYKTVLEMLISTKQTKPSFGNEYSTYYKHKKQVNQNKDYSESISLLTTDSLKPKTSDLSESFYNMHKIKSNPICNHLKSHEYMSKKLKYVKRLLKGRRVQTFIRNRDFSFLKKVQFFCFQTCIKKTESLKPDCFSIRIYFHDLDIQNIHFDGFCVLYIKKDDYSFKVKSLVNDMQFLIIPKTSFTPLIVDVFYFNQIKAHLEFFFENEEPTFDQKMSELTIYTRDPFDSNSSFLSSKCEPKIILRSMIVSMLKSFKQYGEKIYLTNIKIWNDEEIFNAVLRCFYGLYGYFSENQINVSDIYFYENRYHTPIKNHITEEGTCYPINIKYAVNFDDFFHPLSVKKYARYQLNAIFCCKNYYDDIFPLWIQIHYHDKKLISYVKEICSNIEEAFREYKYKHCAQKPNKFHNHLKLKYEKIFMHPNFYKYIAKYSQETPFSHKEFKNIVQIILEKRSSDVYSAILSDITTESASNALFMNSEYNDIMNFLIENTKMTLPNTHSTSKNYLTLDIYAEKLVDNYSFICDSFYDIFEKVFLRINKTLRSAHNVQSDISFNINE
ncbi:hypothetical protein EDEG_01909 [Edhazardia aedis USNM 41457]|uniref:Uncharacterized protein n=1 Tax=Edhazardia aedis (strain USNM 41457) TaxID=1003232 RepID=J9DR47_EDHAE|nr:hypothetical protein EDEG_01909 [Edhazardia aedis USNM 41457]|eukprot:EJW03817.1 hypothetical protein EDEG_01909 [Edhazardia aedis USNM 41457]